MRLFNQTRKIFSVMLCIAIAVCALSVGMTTSAIQYEGKGTKASPYLVETAAQLNGMRENLSAHYKLANTIDMASFGVFTPIGYQGEKFKGTFTCDTNSDGTPKYAIKNLKVYIDAGEKYGHKLHNPASYVDYVEGKTKWQAGLFGYTDGATIKNIAVLNADVTNTVLGQNAGNPDYSRNPGSDQTQSAGILIGTAENTTVIGCMSSGKVNAKSNNSGGLIGYSNEGSVSNCYSTASVTSSGFWYAGGLIGSCNTNVSCCFATGDVKGSPTEACNGGLLGQVVEDSTVMVTSCYSTGNVSPETNGFSMIGFRVTFSAHKENIKERTQNMLNCFTTGSVAGYNSVQTGDTVIENNNFILSTSKGRQDCFKAATMDEIKAALASCADYDVSGDMPKLKNVAVIADESKYVPGKVSETANNATASGDSSETASSSQETSASVEEVAKLIEKLPQALELTIKDKAAVKEAKKAYDALTADQKIEISAELTAKITEVYNKASTLILKQLRKDINELPDVSKLKASDYDKVMAMYDDYEFLNEDTQNFLKKDIKQKLLDAVKKVKAFKEGGDAADADSISSVELAFIIVLAVLIVLVLAFNVVWSIWVIKKNRELNKTMEIEEEIGEV
ncbi:MAG: hypothetical protein J6J39_05150 [Clostridia bacterium]|nr:hypothetical protein [Clostridia bacterium]